MKKKHTGSTVLVPVPDPDNLMRKLLREMGYAEKTPVTGRYIIGSEALTLS